MSINKYSIQAACLLSAISATHAYADVSPQDVWENWKGQLGVYGMEGIDIGNETVTDSKVVVDSLTLRMDDPNSDMQVQSTMGPLVFIDQGDGTVSIEIPDSYPMTLTMDGNEVDLEISIENDAILASGQPEAINYTIAADTYRIDLVSLGEKFDRDGIINDASIVMSGVSGSYTVEEGNLVAIDYDFATDSLALNVDIEQKSGDGYMRGSANLADFAFGFAGTLPTDYQNADPKSYFVNGTDISGSYSITSAEYNFDADIDGPMNGSLTTGAIEVDAAINIDSVSYDATVNDLDVAVSIPSELPFPINTSLDEYNLNLSLPLSASEEPRDFSLGMTLRNLVTDDNIWAMIDPAKQLPRDPATLSFDVSGLTTLYHSIMDPADAEALMMADVPGELNELSLNDLELRAVGAEVFGSGSFTFDNTDMETFGGMPRPEGAIDVKLNGIHALLDKLVEMGFINADDVMMPRMMLGMFAETVGDDQLESRIEINEQGQIFANGQRLQ